MPQTHRARGVLVRMHRVSATHLGAMSLRLWLVTAWLQQVNLELFLWNRF